MASLRDRPSGIELALAYQTAQMASFSDTPLVSLITICRNGMPHIKTCIESLLAQVYQNVEIVVQDGVSTDGTLDVLRSFGQRIRLVSEPDSGHGEAMNRALQRCQGDIIGTCNSDDILLPHAVLWAVGHFRQTESMGAVYGDYLEINECGTIRSSPIRVPSEFDLERVLCIEDVIPMQSAFFRRTALERAGMLSNPWMPRLCEDFLFWLNLGLVTQIGYRPGVISRYRVHTGSGTHQPELWSRIYSSKREVMERFFLRPDVPFQLRSLRSRALGGLALSVARMFLYHFNDMASCMDYIRLAREEQPDASHLQHLFGTLRLWMIPILEYLIHAINMLLDGRQEVALQRLKHLKAIDYWFPLINYTLDKVGANPSVEKAQSAESSAAVLSPWNPQEIPEPADVARLSMPFEWSTARPLIDIILPGPPWQPFSWNQREGWVHALIRTGMLNQVYWAWDNEIVINQIMRSLSRSAADFVLAMSCDHHMPYLCDTPAKEDFWRSLHLPVICHCAERVEGSPFPDSLRKTSTALDVYDAFVYIDELSASLFQSSAKPSVWVPQYVDETLFRPWIPFERRTNRVFFRGQSSNNRLSGVYRARIRLLQHLRSNPLFDLSEAYRPLLTPAQAAEMKAGHRFVLSAPANCTGYSSSLYEALACGCAVFQHTLAPAEVRSGSLFIPGRHFISYRADDPEALANAAAIACQNWQDYAAVAREGMEACLAKHTILIRLREIVEFVSRHWERISRKPSRTIRSSGVRPNRRDRQQKASAGERKTVSSHKCVAKTLPIHFFTIVLNGEPFIRRHFEVFMQLPLMWHWHVVEGVADLVKDTAWSLSNGGRIADCLHSEGLSSDGTTEYLDAMKNGFPEKITIYRKGGGRFWDGKLDMVNTPLSNVNEECLLWQIDVDEFWTVEQIVAGHSLFARHPEKTAAFYRCRFFVGPALVVTSRNTYGNHTDYEWLRTWRYKPGDRWLSHEPPRLCRKDRNGRWIDLSGIEPIRHCETDAKQLVFDHYAYVTENQLRFKEIYYGYEGALDRWKALQKVDRFPVLLKEFFPWVKDNALVDRLNGKIEGCQDKVGFGGILWIRTDSIGDNVLASTMLPHIRRRYPNDRLTIVCQEQVAEIYFNSPYIDKVLTFNLTKATQDESYRNELADTLRAVKANLVLNSVYSRDLLNEFLAMSAGAPARVAFEGDCVNMAPEQHECIKHHYTQIIPNCNSLNELERHRGFLRGIGIDTASLEVSLFLDETEKKFADSYFEENNLDSEKTIALFCGAQFDRDIRNYFNFGKALSGVCKDYGFSIIAMGGAKDYKINQHNIDEASVRSINISGKTTLRQAAALLQRCRLAVGVDTGLAHIATAVATPNVVVVGGGHFGRFFPYSSFNSIACMPLQCYGCNWRCRYRRNHCIQDIDPGVISVAIRQTIEKPSDKPRVFMQQSLLFESETGGLRLTSLDRYLEPGQTQMITIAVGSKSRVVDIGNNGQGGLGPTPGFSWQKISPQTHN
jgi:ADP-heptose:LPS heptosyltransferase/glycosyltransferase involved in cell wall biosynthesis